MLEKKCDSKRNMSSQAESVASKGAKVAASGKILNEVMHFVIGAVVCASIAIWSLTVRVGWKHKLHRVINAECKTLKMHRCTGKNNTQICTEQLEKMCEVHLQGFSKVFQKRVRVGEYTPEINDTLDVFFNPKNMEKTATLKAFPKDIIFIFCGLMCAAQVFFISYHMKLNKKVA